MNDLSKLIKEAQQFRELQQELPILIDLSNVPQYEIIKRSGVADTHFRRLMSNKEKFKAGQLIALLRAIIEIDNFNNIKNKNHVS